MYPRCSYRRKRWGCRVNVRESGPEEAHGEREKHLDIYSPRVVAQPGEAFLATQRLEHLEDARGGRSAGQRHPQRLRHRAELDLLALDERPHRLFERWRGPWLDLRQVGQQ